MKALYTFLIFLLISQYKSETCNAPTNTTEICPNREINEDNDEHVCCGIEYDYINGTNITYCLPLNQGQYENLTGYFHDEVEARGGNTTFIRANIFCESNYIVVSMLSLILLLL